MCRRSIIAVLLLLAALPARAEAPRLPGTVAVPGFQGFRSLLQSPPGMAPPLRAPAANGAWPGWLCRSAIAAAEARHGIPAGLLHAIGMVESGRTDPASGTRMAWPWAVNAEGRGTLFETREAALAFVRGAEAGGMRSIDVGCMQVNRAHHPHAFASLELGFDPATNADYAARFLRQLREGPAGGDWMKAAGFYHSQTAERADAYRARVQAALGAGAAIALAAAPGGGGQGLGNGAERVAMLAMAPGAAGRGLDAYRARPIPVASPMAVPARPPPVLRRGG